MKGNSREYVFVSAPCSEQKAFSYDCHGGALRGAPRLADDPIVFGSLRLSAKASQSEWFRAHAMAEFAGISSTLHRLGGGSVALDVDRSDHMARRD